MSGLIWLDDTDPFPDPAAALPEGLVAAGGRLSIERLTEAYARGIFPWFNDGDPILWWSPDPRMVLACADLKISHSLAKKRRQVARTEQYADARVKVTTDIAFASVIAGCAGRRQTQDGTWISPAIQAAYTAWHRAGVAHSIETWVDGELAGGLYGVCMGRFFFGESMFARVSDASKLALTYLVDFLSIRGITHIDCQQQTAHLASMGARPVGRSDFLALLKRTVHGESPPWKPGQILAGGRLAPLA
ncbi:MAG: leucyl/phenylalanyl-tRNA--protein transferase [Candidimonas sp.]|nr:leucyl/phenylalanyl-tRNA--protein transferase [Candidimonas sp.]